MPAGETPASWLRKLVERGLAKRYAGAATGADSGRGSAGERTFRCTAAPAEVRALIEHELALIAELRYEPYFLTVHDIVAFARSQGILCQGRGSAANSAVCYALGITEVDPARMSMLFERFISKERNEPPDIDVDFEHQRREEVIQYIYAKYGRHRAALAATLITYRPKSAVRDVGKALGLDLAQVDRLTGVFAWWDGREVKPERIREAGFAPDAPVIRRLVTLANRLLGFPRHLSQHVGGFVIARDLLERMVPVENAAMAEPHGDPVGQGRPRRHGPAQGRLPGAGHALRDPPRARPRVQLAGNGVRFNFPVGACRLRRREREIEPDPISAHDAGHSGRGSRRLRDDRPRRYRRRVPDRVAGAAVDAAAPEARQLLRPGHRGGDRAARADPGRHGPPVPAAAAGPRAGHLPQRGGEERARAHARRADLPGTGDAARHRRRRLLAGRGRPPAPLDGGVAAQGRPREVRAASGRRHGGARLPRRVRAADLPADPGLRRIRLSRVALGEFRAAGLRVGVAEVLPPGGVHRRAAQFAADGLLRAGAAGRRTRAGTASRCVPSTSAPATTTARWKWGQVRFPGHDRGDAPAARGYGPVAAPAAAPGAAPRPAPDRRAVGSRRAAADGGARRRAVRPSPTSPTALRSTSAT